ncbi:MAG: hypothetical protein JW924_05165 [Fusobacteriaceae bacterium]|nr:hypothetical protein [Fusobacteriaceae bacterium]
MIYKGSVFVHDIIKNVFKIKLTSEDYKNIGGIECSRNIFYNCVFQNSKFLGENYKIAVKALILDEIKNETKKEKFFKYLKEDLPYNDIYELVHNNPDDIENIVNLTLSKFTNDGTKDDKRKIEPFIEELSELYIKGTKYLSQDKTVAFSLFISMINKITEYIIENENFHYLNNGKKKSDSKMKLNAISHKKIIPKSVQLIIDHVYSIIKVVDTSSSYKNLIELIFIHNKMILKWFLEDYLNDETYFFVLEQKSNDIFYDELEENIKVFGVDELKEIGWSIEDISIKTTEAFNKNIPIRSDNVSKDEEAKIRRIKYQPYTRKLILNKKNEIVGYWVFTPLNDVAFKEAKEGTLKTSDLNPTKIKLLLPGETCNIEFGAVLLTEDYRNYNGYKILIYSIIDHIEKMALNDIYINEIFTKSSNEEGIGFITNMGLRNYKTLPDGKTSLFCGKFQDLLAEKDYLKKFTLLKKLYSKKFSDE